MLQRGVIQIKASAGSGKTYSLTERFLTYLYALNLSHSDSHTATSHLRNIIAMTFTNKAVSEMKEAVIKKLKQIALGDAHPYFDAKKAEEWVNILLEDYHNFRIQSIDSTLLQLLHSISFSLTLPSNCTPLLGTEETSLLQTLYMQYIQRALYEPEILANVTKACNILIQERTAFTDIPRKLRSDTLELVTTMLTQGILYTQNQDDLESILALYEESIEMLVAHYGRKKQEEIFLSLIQQIQDNIIKYNIQHLNANFIKAIHKASYETESKMFTKDSFLDVINTNGKTAIDQQVLVIMEKIYADIKDVLLLRDSVVKVITKAREYAPLVRIASSIIAMLSAYQKKEGVITFSSVPVLLARQFAHDDTTLYEALLHIGKDIDSIFFDEFQDTSQSQWDALVPIIENTLSHGGSFIYVGDVKQAIYSWRGGKSSLFDTIYQDLNYQKEQHTLDTNWRSAPPIVELANIFSEMEDSKYAAQFLYTLLSEEQQKILHTLPDIEEEAIQNLTQGYKDGKQKVSERTSHIKGRIRIVELSSSEADEDEEQEDDSLNSKIKKELALSLQQTLSYAPKNKVAILTRTNNEAKMISEWLLEWNIPYTVEGGLELYTIPLIQHIILMLRFISTPSASTLHDVLSSLLCRDYFINEKEYLLWLSQQKKFSLPAFQQKYTEIWDTYFKPFTHELPSYTPYQYIQECIRCFSLYQRFPHFSLYLDAFLEVALQANAHEITTITTFIEYFEEHKQEYTVAPNSDTDAIQILSIHKSKGLEFPIVYLPFTQAPKKYSLSPKLYLIEDILQNWMIDALKAIKDIPIFTQLNKKNKIFYKEYLNTALENINLLYVAFTRAKEELHIILPPQDSNTPVLSFSRLIQHIITEEELIAKHNIKQSIIQPHATIYEYTSMEETLTPSYTISKEESTPSPQHLIEPTKYTLLEYPPFDFQFDEKEVITDFVLFEHFPQVLSPTKIERNMQIERGILLHKALEYMSSGYSIEQSLLRLSEENVYDSSYYDDIYPRLLWYSKLPQLQEYQIIQGYSEARMVTQEGKELRADRIIETNEAWIIMEYKTGSAYKEHKEQIEEYMHVVHQITQKATQGILIYFDEQSEIPFQVPSDIAVYQYPQ